MSERQEYARESSSSSQDREHEMTIAQILSDENHKVNRSLGKRLSHLNSIKLTPRINGKIPDINNATLDHERLSESFISFSNFSPLNNYAELAKSGNRGDHVNTLAKQTADRFAAKICLLTSFKDNCLIEIVPKEKSPSKELWLSFWSEVHYNSLYGTDDLPGRITKRKHWLF
ncbi:OTU domain-containing protein DDB_G0284757 [Dendrobium catenatum]|uniref:OTU domain-containing protein DDB_G0284757 n=1 Tax=Dendrobium catenatum TaxID=906689 RepID=UPI0010A0C19D|nr:OTU domain-containing protein DDB_G0284757 [Dendrobium catenatum]